MGGKDFESTWGEEDSSVPVGFEVDANVEMMSCGVEVFNTGGDASDRYTALVVSEMAL